MYNVIFIIIIPWLVVLSVSGLELLVAYLQAYVFSTLSSIYIRDVVVS